MPDLMHPAPGSIAKTIHLRPEMQDYGGQVHLRPEMQDYGGQVHLRPEMQNYGGLGTRLHASRYCGASDET